MQNDTQVTNPTKTNTLAIVSIVLAFIIPLAGLIVSIIALSQIKKRQEKGRGLAIASLIVSAFFSIIIPLIIITVFMSVPALQKNSRDTARKTDVALLSSNIYMYQTENSGALPNIAAIDTQDATTVTAITESGSPTTTTALYIRGTDCAGVKNKTSFSLVVKLENNEPYCID